VALRELLSPGAGVCALLLAAPALAESGTFRIRHAESIGVTGAALRADATSSKAEARTLSFVAYGRHFDLELEPNSRLLSGLDFEQRRSLAGYGIYRGRLRNLAGSWVRIVRAGDALTGAIWDGSDLYSIGPARALGAFLEQPMPTASIGGLAIYRLADTVGGAEGGSCLVAQATGEARKSPAPLTSYKNLVEELRMNALQLPDRQIEVAFIGDTAFGTRHADPQAAALTRINIVDGIFSDQVGVILAAPVLRFFPSAGPDPFLSTAPVTMLQELGQYRTQTQDVRDRGLAHLLTGKDVAGNVIGAAFLGALCEVEAGVGFAESWHPDLMSALITAHELGHNFNAPHDGEAGPCASVQTATLMSPALNFQRHFSQCGLHQMYAEMETASCIVAGNAADAQMGTVGLVTPALGETFDVPFDVSSVGTADIPSARVTIQLPQDLAFVSADLAIGLCSRTGNVATCDAGTIPAGASRAGNLRLSAPSNGRREITMQVSAPGDRRDVNDTATAVVDIGTGTDVSVGVSPSTIVASSGQGFSFIVTVAAVGDSAVNGVVVTLPPTGLTLDTVQAPGASCTTGNGASCTYGTLAAGEARQLVIQARGNFAADFPYIVSAQASNDANPANNSRAVRIVINPAADAAIQAVIESRDRAIGESFDLVFSVASVGPQPVTNVVARMTIPPHFVVESAAVGGTACTVNAAEVQCALGTMAPRTSRRMAVRGHAVAVTSGFGARVSATNDANPANDTAFVSVHIKPAVDVSMSVVGPLGMIEGRTSQVSMHVGSQGVVAAREVTARATLPASFEVLQASFGSTGTCQVSGNTASCNLASLQPNTGVQMVMQIRPAQAGVFTGSFFSIDSPDDTTPDNNTQLVQVFVGEDFDASVSGPTGLLGGIVGQPLDIPLTVRTGVQPMTNVRLSLITSSGVQLESVTPDIACTIAGGTLTCPLGNLPGKANMLITPRLRFAQPAQGSATARIQADRDAVADNDFAAFMLAVDEPADLALSAPRASINAIAGLDFLVELRVTASGPNAARNVHTRLPLPAGMLLGSSRQAGCTVQNAVIECPVGTLEAGGARMLGFDLRASTPGTYPLDASVVATNDASSQNDGARITVTVAAAAAASPPPSSGGGGGGAVGWALLILLSSLATKQNYRLKMAG
jgi:hypothetical protein